MSAETLREYEINAASSASHGVDNLVNLQFLARVNGAFISRQSVFPPMGGLQRGLTRAPVARSEVHDCIGSANHPSV